MVIPLHTPTRRLAAARDFLLRCADRVHEALRELAGAWRYGVARRQMAALDDHTLRDLGVHRSELGSYFVESQQWTEPTRKRIALIIDGQVGR
jgi:uncharacterized protein YjiS (DUF1127 family)